VAELPTTSDLASLPLRAVVAYAARCAKRVFPLNAVWAQLDPLALDVIRKAIAQSEAFARGEPVRLDQAEEDVGLTAFRADHEAAYAAVYAHRATVYSSFVADRNDVLDADRATTFAALADDVAAFAAAEAARDTYEAAFEAAVDAARSDFLQLKFMDLGEPHTLGQPVDPGERGPMGPLWPGGPPSWSNVQREPLPPPEPDPFGEADND